jgi:Protein of unknown function (DUF1353)
MELRLAFTLWLSGTCLCSAQGNWGSFDPGSVQVAFLPPPGHNIKLLIDYKYTDPSKKVWLAPKGTISDGATIPQPFWSVTGGPLDGPYRDAAILHDVACCERTSTWQDVALMFYNAMRCSGVSEVQAKYMYYAVYHFGPKWGQLNSKRPADCLDTQKARVSTSVATQRFEYVRTQPLTFDDKKAVLRPLIGREPREDEVQSLFSQSVTSNLSLRNKKSIAESLENSEKISDAQVHKIADWIQRENPSLETLQKGQLPIAATPTTTPSP